MRRIKGKEYKYGISRKKKSKQPAKGMRSSRSRKMPRSSTIHTISYSLG
jgi:hypothetical protein